MSTRTSEFYFDVLQVNRQSSKDEIKSSYRRLIKKWHPDKFQLNSKDYNEATEKSKLLNEAYNILKNYIPDTQYKSEKFASKSSSQNSKQNIQRNRVNSSNIYSVGYDSESNILQIQFMNNQVYEYYNVPQKVYDEFMKAQSKGKFAIQNIYYSYKYQNVS